MTQKSLSITNLASGVLLAASTGYTIYAAAANVMDAVKTQGSLTGVKKKEAVMAFIKGYVFDIGQNWDVYEQLISTFIDQIKAAYNAVKDLFK